MAYLALIRGLVWFTGQLIARAAPPIYCAGCGGFYKAGTHTCAEPRAQRK